MLTVHLHFLINVCLLEKYPWSNLTELNAAKPNCSRSCLNLSDYLKGGSSWVLSLCLLVVILYGVLGFVTRTILHNYESKWLDVLSTKFSYTLKSDTGDLQETTKYRRVCNKNSRNWKQLPGTLSIIIYNSIQTLPTLGIGTVFYEWSTHFEPVPRAGSTIPALLLHGNASYGTSFCGSLPHFALLLVLAQIQSYFEREKQAAAT